MREKTDEELKELCAPSTDCYPSGQAGTASATGSSGAMLPDAVPASEFSQTFVQGMANRMAMSYFKYGKVADAYPHKVDALRSMQVRLDKYAATGNTEHLIDAANFLMIEFMHPKHPDAHFTPEDSKASPGRVFHGEIDRSQRGNRDI